MVGAMMVQQINILICEGATRTSQLGLADFLLGPP
jgi:hypothetical protein